MSEHTDEGIVVLLERYYTEISSRGFIFSMVDPKQIVDPFKRRELPKTILAAQQVKEGAKMALYLLHKMRSDKETKSGEES